MDDLSETKNCALPPAIFLDPSRLNYSFKVAYACGIPLALRKILIQNDLLAKYSKLRTSHANWRSGRVDQVRSARQNFGSELDCGVLGAHVPSLPLSRFLSKGCASQQQNFLLWKAVEKGLALVVAILLSVFGLPGFRNCEGGSRQLRLSLHGRRQRRGDRASPCRALELSHSSQNRA